MMMALAGGGAGAGKSIITATSSITSLKNTVIKTTSSSIPMITTSPLFSKPGNDLSLLFQSKAPTSGTSLSCVASITAAVSDGQVHQSINPTTSTTTWLEFASNVSGEWDGFGADFTAEGKPIELPESVVPEAYREWEVKIFDWQTQCPALAQPQDLLLTYKTIKLLPTVGCEADAATRYSIDDWVVGGVENGVSAFAYQSDGSYVAVWPIEDNVKYKKLELEHCLINPRDKESRMRIIQVIRVTNTGMELQSIRVFCEQWYGPFRNGDQLGGCAIRDSAFASTAVLKASEVVGAWQGPSAVASFDASHKEFLQELLGDVLQESVRDKRDLILLPRQLWCSLKRNKDGETCCEVGWLFDQESSVTSRCIFLSNVKLKEISMAHETAVSEGA